MQTKAEKPKQHFPPAQASRAVEEITRPTAILLLFVFFPSVFRGQEAWPCPAAPSSKRMHRAEAFGWGRTQSATTVCPEKTHFSPLLPFSISPRFQVPVCRAPAGWATLETRGHAECTCCTHLQNLHPSAPSLTSHGRTHASDEEHAPCHAFQVREILCSHTEASRSNF